MSILVIKGLRNILSLENISKEWCVGILGTISSPFPGLCIWLRGNSLYIRLRAQKYLERGMDWEFIFQIFHNEIVEENIHLDIRPSTSALSGQSASVTSP